MQKMNIYDKKIKLVVFTAALLLAGFGFTEKASAESYRVVSKLSTNANDITSWGAASVLASTTSANTYGTVAALAGGDMYAVFATGTAITGIKYTSGSGWGGTTTIANIPTGLEHSMSLTSDPAVGMAYLSYIDSDGKTEFKKLDPFSCGDSITDIDGHSYNTVEIGTQCWMASNLYVTRNPDGSALDTSGDPDTNFPLAYAIDPDVSTSSEGLKYNWQTAMNGATASGSQGICPDGWHIPDHWEWTDLERYICETEVNGSCDTTFPKDMSATGYHGTNEGTELKSATNVSGMEGTDPQGDDGYDFTALLAGNRFADGSFSNRSTYANFWSSTESSATNAWNRNLYYNGAGVSRSGVVAKGYGFSVRCVKDEATSATLDTNSGNDYPAISVDTANSNDLYAYWVRDNTVYSKSASTPYIAWSATSTLITGGTNKWLSAAYRDGNGFMTFIYTEGSDSPYDVNFYGVNADANTVSAALGMPLSATNTPALIADTDGTFRLRATMHVANDSVSQSGGNYTLQYGPKIAGCAAASYATVTAATAISFYDNAGLDDGDGISATSTDPGDGHTINYQTYEESNDFTNSGSAIASGEDGMWEWSLADNGAPFDRTYCFRIVEASGAVLTAYTHYPEITTPPNIYIFEGEIQFEGDIRFD